MESSKFGINIPLTWTPLTAASTETSGMDTSFLDKWVPKISIQATPPSPVKLDYGHYGLSPLLAYSPSPRYPDKEIVDVTLVGTADDWEAAKVACRLRQGMDDSTRFTNCIMARLINSRLKEGLAAHVGGGGSYNVYRKEQLPYRYRLSCCSLYTGFNAELREIVRDFDESFAAHSNQTPRPVVVTIKLPRELLRTKE